MHRLRSLTARVVLSHILVASLTGAIVSLMLVGVVLLGSQNLSAADYRYVAVVSLTGWELGLEDGKPNSPGLPDGFSLVVAPDDTVLFSYGSTGCRSGIALSKCAPDLVGLPMGERFFDREGERWAEVIFTVQTGQRVISRYGPPTTQLYLALPGNPIVGNWQVTVVVMAAMIVLSLPVAFTLAWFSARPMARRLHRVTHASRQFAAGKLQVRIADRTKDEVGDLSRQFDDMADTLEHNMSVLRDLAQRNAELVQKAEEAAITAERVRLSRDLHDDIAQQLFSLSVSSASLPELIERDRERGIQQARAIAHLSEKTLLDLRDLLVELRPSRVLQRGLCEALNTLCQEWQAQNAIAVDCSVVLTGQHLRAGVEDVIYRVAQESLNNIAKHAGASSVQLSLVEGQRQITLSTTDDGKGFKDNAIPAMGKFGLISMRERAAAVGGELTIESDTRRGTTVRLTLPLQIEEAA